MEQDDPIGVLGQRQGLVGCGVAAAHDGNGLTHVHRAVAGCAVGNSAPVELFLAGDAQRAQRRTGGHDDGLPAITVAAVAGDLQVIAVDGDVRGRIHQHCYAGVHGLFLGGRSEFVAGDALGEARIVLDALQVDDLGAGHHLLNDGGAEAVAGSIDAGGQAGHAAADDDNVVILIGHWFTSLGIG